MELGQSMEVDDPKVNPDGQGYRSKVKVIRSKNPIWDLIWQAYKY